MIDHIARHKATYICFGINIILLIAASVWAARALGGISQPLIIHFNSIAGINQIGSLRDIFQILGVGAVFAVLDFLIALEFDFRSPVLSRFVSFAAVFFVLLIFIGLFLIIRANI